jgi:hypothetical protein
MYTPEILRGKAAQCRQLAAGSGKRPGRGRYLLDLAESYENEAAELEARHGGNKPSEEKTTQQTAGQKSD